MSNVKPLLSFVTFVCLLGLWSHSLLIVNFVVLGAKVTLSFDNRYSPHDMKQVRHPRSFSPSLCAQLLPSLPASGHH